MRAGIQWCKKLHRFFIAIARAALNDDWCGWYYFYILLSGRLLLLTLGGGGLSKRFAILPGYQALRSLWVSVWYQMPVACIGEADVAVWPFSVDVLVKFVHFLG